MIAWDEIQLALPTIETVMSGTSSALRGIVTLQSGQKVFVKIATNQHTHESIQSEIRTYLWLEQSGYRHAARLVAHSDDHSGLALEDMSDYDWSHDWDQSKLAAALQALDDLQKLPGADLAFQPSPYSPYPGNPWERLPDSAGGYRTFINADSLQAIDLILHDTKQRRAYVNIANKEPWHGTDLVHYDARADNFAYDQAERRGVFVDWNWAGLGSSLFDQTALLVTVQLSGFDVMQECRQRIDRDSLIWLIGFWLERGLGPQDTEGRRRLRPLQVANALQASKMLKAL